jgi:hypothetical protein
MIESLIIILLVLWILGLLGHVAGGLIHLLLVAALIAFIYRMVREGRNG